MKDELDPRLALGGRGGTGAVVQLPGGAAEPLGDGARKLAHDRSGMLRLGEALSGPGVDRDDGAEEAHQMPRFLALNRRGRRTAGRCVSTVVA